MRFLIAFSLFVSLSPAALVVSNVRYEDLSHSSLRLHWDVSGGPWQSLRVRFIPTAGGGSCLGGTGGKVMETYYPGGAGDDRAERNSPVGTIIVGGLEPGVESMICPELWDGSSWTSGQGVSVTTPAGHPAGQPTAPIPPELFDTSYPDMTGATNLVVGTDCPGIYACVDAAIIGQGSHKYNIYLHAGSTYKDVGWPSQKAVDRHVFTTTDVINNAIISTSHGLTTGDRVRFGHAYPSGCLPQSGAPNCDSVNDTQGLQPGRFYYVNVLSADKFQCYSGATAANGGVLIPIPNAGGATEWWVKAERPDLNWIVIRTDTPDAQFAPEHTRVNPTWLPKMATWMLPSERIRSNQNINILFQAENVDGNDQNMTAKIRVMGVRFTYENDGTNNDGPDNYPGFRLWQVGPTSGQIVMDRCIVDSNGIPVFTAIGWDGYKSAIVDSYIYKLNKGHGVNWGLGVTQ